MQSPKKISLVQGFLPKLPIMSQIEHVIFDFDGTCTQIPPIYEAFSDEYRKNFSRALKKSAVEEVMKKSVEAAKEAEANWGAVTTEEWAAAQTLVRANSPQEGWSVGGTPSAPVAADPYILADESAKLISRRRGLPPPSGSGLHSGAYHQFPAPWRPESREIMCEIHRRGISIHFISNSSSQTVSDRLDELLADEPKVRKDISIESNAGKFFIREVTWGASRYVNEQLVETFEGLPPAEDPAGVPFSRPIYLRRGSYFEAICRALANNTAALPKTLVCGDVWELDLAMPFYLQMHVHLIERASPFDTYEYERAKIKSCGVRGGKSWDLKGLLDRLED